MEGHLLIVGSHDESRGVLGRFFYQAKVKAQWRQTLRGSMGALAQHPAAIVLDLSLPDGDGIELLRAVRETGCRSKVAVLSSGASSTSLAELTALQPDAIFGKPLDFEDFAEWLAANFQGFGGPKAIEPVIKQIERRATYSRAA